MMAAPSLATVVAEAKAGVSLPALVGQSIRLRRVGRNHVGLCPFHGEKTPSFYVYAEHYHCFGCGAHGDAIAWMRETRGLSFRDALRDLGAGIAFDGPVTPIPILAKGISNADTHNVLAEGRAAWDASNEPDVTTVAFLRGRCLDLPPEPVIRSRPRVWWDVLRQHPEMLVRVDDPVTGQPVGCQITRLAPGGAGKAPVKRPRITLSTGGFVRLYTPGRTLIVAEGTETALAAAAIFGEPAWACLGSEMLAKAPPLPEIVRTVLIAADNDWPGREAAREATAAYRSRGLTVLERVPTKPDADFNDVLLGRAPGGSHE